jgi:hypothetical protein
VSNRETGLIAQRGGVIVADSSLVRDPRPNLKPSPSSGQFFGAGAIAVSGGQLTLSASALVNSRSMGIFERDSGTIATVTATLIDGVALDQSGAYGRGVNVQDGAKVELTGSAILRTHDVGLGAFGGEVIATDCLISETDHGTIQPPHGIGVAAAFSSKFTAVRTTIAASADIGLLVSGSSTYVTGSFLSNNPIAVNVQDGSSLIEQNEPSDDPLAAVISKDTHFVANETRVGSGAVPIPEPGGAVE